MRYFVYYLIGLVLMAVAAVVAPSNVEVANVWGGAGIGVVVLSVVEAFARILELHTELKQKAKQ